MHSRNFEPGSFDQKHERKAYYHSHSRRLVYDQIKKKVLVGQGILCINGEEGIGKSFLLQELAAELASEATFINLPSQGQTFQSLINELSEDLGLSTGKEIILVALQSIYKFLEEQHQENSRYVVVIDNADQLQASVLDKLLLLSVAPSYQSASLQLIFSGQTEIASKFNPGKQPHIKNSKFFSYQINRLDASETLEFIKYFLTRSDYNHIDLFTSAALSNIVDFSSGVPRRIKSICDAALSAIGAPEAPKITEKIINYVAKELLLVPLESVNDTLSDEFISLDNTRQQEPSVLTTDYMLSMARAEVCDTIDEQVGQSAQPQGSLVNTESGSQVQTNPSFVESVVASYIEQEDNGLGATTNSEPKPLLSWGVAAILVLGLALIGYRSFVSQLDTKATIAAPTQPQASQPAINGGNITDNTSPVVTGKLNSLSENDLEQFANTGTIAPGTAARSFIAELEKTGESINLDMIYDQAEMLSNQNQPVDTYILNFYAAKRGHAKAAFRLAQMTDPATFSKKSSFSLFKKADVTQANKWYIQAVYAGHPEAKRFLKQMRDKVKHKAAAGDEIAQRLLLQFENSKI